jgi:hypothetical protein
MRANIRMSTTDDIMLSKLIRDLEMKQRDVQTAQAEEDMTFMLYCAVFCIVMTGIVMVLAYT